MDVLEEPEPQKENRAWVIGILIFLLALAAGILQCGCQSSVVSTEPIVVVQQEDGAIQNPLAPILGKWIRIESGSHQDSISIVFVTGELVHIGNQYYLAKVSGQQFVLHQTLDDEVVVTLSGKDKATFAVSGKINQYLKGEWHR